MKYPLINRKTKEFLTEEDFINLERARSVKDIFSVAEKIIERMPGDLAQVCGPITSGGERRGGREFRISKFQNKRIA